MVECIFKHGHVICALGRFASSLGDKHMEVTAVRCSCFSGKAVLMNVRDDRQKKKKGHLRQWLRQVNK